MDSREQEGVRLLVEDLEATFGQSERVQYNVVMIVWVCWIT